MARRSDEEAGAPGANAAAFSPGADNVFARIADRYDRLCDVFSLFAHRVWKARMAARMSERPVGLVLDVASGTGDIPVRLLRRLGRGAGEWAGRIVVTDLCPEMLAIARRKVAAQTAALDGRTVDIAFAIADTHDLRGVEAGSVDLFSISFGMKICDRERVMAEAFRVLRPGGQFLCLEAARIPFAPLHALYLAYMERCIPAIGWLATRDPSAYGYLLRGIRDFPAPSDLARELEAQGFRGVAYELMTFGIVALHRATKPKPEARAG